MYFAYLQSSLKYTVLYSGEMLEILKKICKLQNTAKRFIANISSTTSWKPYFKKLKFMTLLCIYGYEILLHTKMYLSRFKTNSLFHSYNTRNMSDLFITSHNNKLFEQSITYKGRSLENRIFFFLQSIYCKH
jgi:hypothetical protein